MTMAELRHQTPPVYRGTPPKMTVQHNCPNCGKVRKTDISAGYDDKITMCTACDTQYSLNREMHVPGLVNRREP